MQWTVSVRMECLQNRELNIFTGKKYREIEIMYRESLYLVIIVKKWELEVNKWYSNNMNNFQWNKKFEVFYWEFSNRTV